MKAAPGLSTSNICNGLAALCIQSQAGELDGVSDCLENVQIDVLAVASIPYQDLSSGLISVVEPNILG